VLPRPGLRNHPRSAISYLTWRFWKFVTDFGDTAVTLPLAVLMLCFLFATRQPRPAVGWALAIVGCAAATATLKIVLAACGYPLGGPGQASPSGHTAMSIAVYGGYAAVLGANLARPARELTLAGAAILLIGISLSRVMIRAHSPLEVWIGLGVGAAALGAIIMIVVRYQRGALPIRWLVLPALAVALLFHGDSLSAEQAIDWLVEILRPWCSWL
jgi:membrane-associated phospholipid phosphatase